MTRKPLLNDIKFYGPLALKGVWWGSLMHTYGEEFLSKTLTVIGIYYNFYCLFVLKSDEYKLLDLHRLKLIHFIFWV